MNAQNFDYTEIPDLQRETEAREQSSARDRKKTKKEDKIMKQFNNASIYAAGGKGNEYLYLIGSIRQVVERGWI